VQLLPPSGSTDSVEPRAGEEPLATVPAAALTGAPATAPGG